MYLLLWLLCITEIMSEKYEYDMKNNQQTNESVIFCN